MNKVLVAGLNDDRGGPYRQMILDAMPKTSLVFFMKPRDSLGLMGHVELVLCCHPAVYRLVYGLTQREEKGWWDSKQGSWWYLTNRYTLEDDLIDMKDILRVMGAFNGSKQAEAPG